MKSDSIKGKKAFFRSGNLIEPKAYRIVVDNETDIIPDNPLFQKTFKQCFTINGEQIERALNYYIIKKGRV